MQGSLSEEGTAELEGCEQQSGKGLGERVPGRGNSRYKSLEAGKNKMAFLRNKTEPSPGTAPIILSARQ